MPRNWAFVAAKRLVKKGVKFVVKKSGHFQASFPEKKERETTNFRQKFPALSMVTSTRGFRRKFHGSTSASLARTTDVSEAHH